MKTKLFIASLIVANITFGQIYTPEVEVKVISSNFTGIGISTPLYPFHLSGDGGSNQPLATFYLNSVNNHGGMVINSSLDKQSHIRFSENGTLQWQLRVANQIDNNFRIFNWSANEDVLVIENNTGYVGVGIATPKAIVHLASSNNQESLIIGDGPYESTDRNNSITFTDANIGEGDNGIRWLDGSGALSGYIYGTNSTGNNMTLGSSQGHVRILANGERIRINSDGKVGIGTTTPSYLLDVSGTARVTTLIESSDERLKKDIQEYNSDEKLSSVKSYRYKLKQPDQPIESDTSQVLVSSINDQMYSKEHIGLIAQEVEQIYPDMVYTDDQGFKAIAYGQFIPILINRTNELSQEIEDLKTLVAEMQRELNELKE